MHSTECSHKQAACTAHIICYLWCSIYWGYFRNQPRVLSAHDPLLTINESYRHLFCVELIEVYILSFLVADDNQSWIFWKHWVAGTSAHRPAVDCGSRMRGSCHLPFLHPHHCLHQVSCSPKQNSTFLPVFHIF